jgi:hypothetical protein
LLFSDANPVQFWNINCDTFNEKEVDGVFARCFCAPFNYDDEITIQFTDASGNAFTLYVLDSDNNILYTSSVSGSNNTFTHSFTPSAQGITEDEVQIFIVSNGGGASVINSLFASNLDGWVNEGSGVSWLWDSSEGGCATTALGLNNQSTKQLVMYVSGAETTMLYNLVLDIVLFTFTSQTANLLIQAYDGGTLVSTLYDEDIVFSASQSYPINTIVAIPKFTNIKVTYSTNGESNIFLKSYVSAVKGGTGAKSDCIDIKPDHDETVLINYHNNRVFASLNSSVGTPDPEFNLRIPAIFFEERFPEEIEEIELSDNSSIQLNAQVKSQKFLKVKPMPFYMHKKTKLALSFQTVTIDGEEWIKSEAYEIQAGNERHPFRKATCWLTEKDYLVRNVL